MTSSTLLQSPYEKRVELVTQTLMSTSKLDVDAAEKLAIDVLHALNSIPEKIR